MEHPYFVVLHLGNNEFTPLILHSISPWNTSWHIMEHWLENTALRSFYQHFFCLFIVYWGIFDVNVEKNQNYVVTVRLWFTQKYSRREYGIVCMEQYLYCCFILWNFSTTTLPHWIATLYPSVISLKWGYCVTVQVTYPWGRSFFFTRILTNALRQTRYYVYPEPDDWNLEEPYGFLQWSNCTTIVDLTLSWNVGWVILRFNLRSNNFTIHPLLLLLLIVVVLQRVLALEFLCMVKVVTSVKS